MPNSLLAAEKEMFGRLIANFPAGFTESLLQLPNLEFETPNNGPWLRATMIPTSTKNTDATGARERTRGLFVVDVFYPKFSGSHDAWETAEAIKTLFRNQCTENVNFYEADISPLNDDNWYHLQIDINYTHEGLTDAN